MLPISDGFWRLVQLNFFVCPFKTFGSETYKGYFVWWPSFIFMKIPIWNHSDKLGASDLAKGTVYLYQPTLLSSLNFLVIYYEPCPWLVDLSLFSTSLKVRLWVCVFFWIFCWRVRSFVCFDCHCQVSLEPSKELLSANQKTREKFRLSFFPFHQNASHTRHGMHVLFHLKKWVSREVLSGFWSWIEPIRYSSPEHVGAFMHVQMSADSGRNLVRWHFFIPISVQELLRM